MIKWKNPTTKLSVNPSVALNFSKSNKKQGSGSNNFHKKGEGVGKKWGSDLRDIYFTYP